MSNSSSTPKRKSAPEIEVPDLTADAAERKRVLNVLAQRRYRQRKREHLKNLEAQVKSPGTSSSGSSPGIQTDNADTGGVRLQNSGQTGIRGDNGRVTFQGQNGGISVLGANNISDPLYTMPYQTYSFENPRPTTQPQTEAVSFDSFQPQFPSCDAIPPAWTLSENPTGAEALPWDITMLLPTLPNTPASYSEDLYPSTTTEEPSSTSSPSGPYSTPVQLRTPSPSHHFRQTSPYQRPRSPSTATFASTSSSSSITSFADTANFAILELNLLRASQTIAERLRISDVIWSLEATSPFSLSSSSLPSSPISSPTFSHLPPNLRPTPIQLSIPHHPMLDILPWPSVRNKLILILSRPPSQRPPIAASPTVLIDLVSDVEDSAEGVRVSGEDPCSDQNWEVGQKLFEGWWWAFDGDIIRRSNRLRRDRGPGRWSPGGRGTVACWARWAEVMN